MFSYNYNLEKPSDKLRFNIQDNKEPGHLFEDEELIAIYNMNGNDINKASYKLCLTMATLYAAEPDEKLGPYSISYKDMAKKFSSLAEMYRRLGYMTVKGFAGGISKQEVIMNETDDDIIKNAFRRNIMNYYSRSEAGGRYE